MADMNFTVIEESKDANFARFVLEPLAPGFGQTLGVALRRVLLTNIEGAAVTQISIEGVKHMFSTIPGLKEDIIEFVLNVKGIHVKLDSAKTEARMTLKKVGPGEITAGDIEVTEGIEIVNPDHYLGSLADKKAKVELEFTVEKGTGYSLAEERRVSTVGVMPVDAMFSPVVKVSYKIEQTRVGRQTNFDKLILEVWTNGTIDPKDALMQASTTLVNHFAQVIEPRTEGAVVEGSAAVLPSVSDDVMRMTIDELDLPTRIYNSLRNAGIETVGQLLTIPKKDLMNYRNLGAKSLSLIEEGLRAKGISFN